jgi:hypothetical protein
MSKYIGTPVVSLSTDTVDVTGDITTTDATPEVIIVNDTHEDTDGGREGKLTFKGQASGGEETTLAQIQASHDGTVDDEKGDLIFKTNDGSDGASPTEAMRIDSAGDVGIGTTDPSNSRLNVSDTHTTTVTNAATLIANATLTINGNSGQGSDVIRMGPMCSSGSQYIDASNGAGSAAYALCLNPINGGSVGIGTTAPLRQLSIANSGAAEMSFISGTSSNASILFGDGLTGTDVYRGYIQYEHANDAMAFAAGVVESMRLTGGKVLAGTTSLLGGFHNASTIQVSGANQGISITSTGAGTQSPVAVWQQNSSGYLQYFTATSSNTKVGEITTDGTGTSYGTSSDYRLKENVTDIPDGITRVKQLAPKRFNFIANADKTVDGFLAHEAQTVVPEAVTGTKDAMTEEVLYVDGDEIPEGKKVGDVKTASTISPQGIDQSKLVPLLTAALQEAIAKIETLETKVAALEGE